MSAQSKLPRRPANLWKWFDPRHREAGSWGFVVNRLAGLGLTLYLFLHLIMLGQLARGPEAYNGFIALVKNPIFIFGEFLVVAAGLLHGLNGVRIILTSFGLANRYQKALLIGLMSVALIGCVWFGIHMFGGEG